jgi:hypothetical protein
LDRKSTSGFVEGDYGNNLPTILCNITIELNSAAEEVLKNGVWMKGFSFYQGSS